MIESSKAVLTADELAERWRLSRNTIAAEWRQGRIPAPLNSHAGRNYRWSLATVEAFERGEWKPEDAA